MLDCMQIFLRFDSGKTLQHCGRAALFINNCALMESPYVLEKRSLSFLHQLLKTTERADFTVIHNSPSIGAGPGISLFRKLKGGEQSHTVLS